MGPSSSPSEEKEASSESFNMQSLQDQLYDILDLAEQVISVPKEDKQQVVKESSPLSPSEQKQIYGFQTDSTWDEFCDDLPLE